MAPPEARLPVRITVNGESHELMVEARLTLADFLRERLRLTGTHLGCEHGVCGACTVLLDDVPTRSCLTLAVQADGAHVLTVEGLGTPEDLHPLQAAFQRHHALQCGFCTAGFLVSATALLRETPAPSEGDVREWLSGNLCRCTGYQFIVDAVLSAAAELRGDGKAPSAP